MAAERSRAETDAGRERWLADRAVIEQAKGVLVGTVGCSPDRAFELLRAESQHRNVKLREVAAELVRSKVRSVGGLGASVGGAGGAGGASAAAGDPAPGGPASDGGARRSEPGQEGRQLVDGR